MTVLLSILVAIVSVPGTTTVTHSPGAEIVTPYHVPSTFRFLIDGAVVPQVESIDFSPRGIVVVTRPGISAVEYRQTVPGNAKWGPVTLKRGMTTDNSLFEWRMKVVNGQIDSARKECELDTTTDQWHTKVQYLLHRCWPTRYQTTELTRQPGAHASETIVIEFETLEIKK